MFSMTRKRFIATIILAITSVVFFTFFPLLVNDILFSNVGSKEIIDNIGNAWVGYIGSYVSAITGGIISGGLTLVGVLMTLKDSKKERYKESLPEKLSNIDNITFYFGAEYNRYIPEEELKAIKLINKLKYEIKDNYLAISAKVNLNTYKYVSKIYGEVFDFVEEYVDSNDKDNFTVKYQDDQTKIEIKAMKVKLLQTVKALRKEKEILESQLKEYE